MISSCDKFVVERVTFDEGGSLDGFLDGDTFEVWGVLSGAMDVETSGGRRSLQGVRFALFPATMGTYELHSEAGAVALRAYLPEIDPD